MDRGSPRVGAGAADPAGSRPLELSGAQLRDLLDAVGSHLVALVDALPDAPASRYEGVADPTLRRSPPERGRDLRSVLADLDRCAAVGVNPASPCRTRRTGDCRISATTAPS